MEQPAAVSRGRLRSVLATFGTTLPMSAADSFRMTPSKFVATRRSAIAAAGAAGLAWMSGLGRATTSTRSDEKPHEPTWLTYAVNAEMFWSNLPFEERLKRIAEAGFAHYEFWPWRNKNLDRVAELNRELGLKPVQFTAFWGITHPNRRDLFLNDLAEAIGVAQTLGLDLLTVVAGEESPGLPRDEQTRAVVETLRAGAELVAPAGITLILEPLNVLVDHPKQLVVTSQQAAQVIDAVGSPHVKILFDVYHQQISEGNLSGNIRAHKERIGYYQIADHPGRNEPFTGEIHYPHILKVIHETGQTRPIGLELRPRRDPLQALAAVRRADAEARVLAQA